MPRLTTPTITEELVASKVMALERHYARFDDATLLTHAVALHRVMERAALTRIATAPSALEDAIADVGAELLRGAERAARLASTARTEQERLTA